MKKIVLICCIAFGVYTCKDEYEPDGYQNDTIKFSTNTLSFNAKGGDAIVTSEGDNWHIDCLYINDGDGWDLPSVYDNFLVEIDSSENGFRDIIKMTGSWFIIDKETKQKIAFSVSPNNTGKVRTLMLTVMDRNFGAGITVTQSAE